LGIANEDKATRYHRRRRRADLLGTLAAAAVLVALVASGASHALASALTPAPPTSVLRCVVSTAVFTLLLGAPLLLARFPFDVFREWTLDRLYGLERTPFGVWLGGYVRGIAVLAVLLVAALLVIRLATLAGSLWWLAAALMLWAGQLTWTLAAPLVLFVFGGLRPLARPHVQERLHALGQRAGAVLDVYEWRGGDDSRRAHAALGGVGRTRRVILSDTLLESLTVDEVEVVVAHELAHHVHGDVWTTTVWRLVVLTAGAAAANWALSSMPLVGATPPGHLAALPIIVAAFWLVSALLAPIGYAISRAQERRADRFAIETTGNREAFLTSMRRLAASNLADEQPSRLARLFSSHPSIRDRMAAAVDRPAPSRG
jgi:STE24 endopeptidase